MRLTRVFEFYGSLDFLTAFLLEDEYSGMRNSILMNFTILLKRYEREEQGTETKRISILKPPPPPQV